MVQQKTKTLYYIKKITNYYYRLFSVCMHAFKFGWSVPTLAKVIYGC